MADYTVKEVNAWTLRCMFNRSNIVERYEAGEFTATPRRKSNPSKWPNHPKDTRSYYFTFRDKDGNEVATAHRYICPEGPVTPFDPKTLKIGALRYTLHPDPGQANPEENLPFKWMKRCYGWVRRNIICPVFGPLAVLPEQASQVFFVPLILMPRALS
jgi:hypothetical protein